MDWKVKRKRKPPSFPLIIHEKKMFSDPSSDPSSFSKEIFVLRFYTLLHIAKVPF